MRGTFRWTSGQPEERAALVIASAVLVAGGVAWAAGTAHGRPAPFAVDPQTTPFYGPHEVSAHLSLIKPFFDARSQTVAHLVMTGVLALAVLRGPDPHVTREASRVAGRWGALLALVVFLAPFYAPGPKATAFILALPVLLALLLVGRSRRRPAANAALGMLVVAAVALAILPGFLSPPDFSRVPWPEMTFAESHWSVVMAAGDLLASGRKLFEDVRPDYGILLPLFVAGATRLLGPLSFGDQVHMLQGLQALYVSLAGFLFWRHARGRWLLVAVALATVLPWYHFAQRSLLFPNQSPWRTIGVPLSLLALLLLRTDTLRPDAFRLGAVGGVALLLNFESGAAMAAALATFLYFRYGAARGPGRARRMGTLALPFLGGLLSASMVTILLGRLLSGQWIPLLRLPSLFVNAVFLSSAGFSGFPFVPDPWPILIFGHAAFVLVQTALAPRAAAGFRASFRAAVSAAIVVWFAYYANRPHPWNLSSYYFLYGFLLIDLLRALSAAAARRRMGPLLAVGLGVAATVVLPNVIAMAAKGGRQVEAALGPALRRSVPAQARLVSDVYLEEAGAADVVAKAATIRARQAEAPIYFTADSWLVPKVSGVFSAMPAVDACWESMTRVAYRRLVEAVVASEAPRVYFDPPGTPAYYTACEAFYRGLRTDLTGRFAPGGTEGGWEVWIRR